jgi:hypothetical protein
MTSHANLPSRLYKYRAFDSRLIEQLVDDKVFLAEPSTFNDPLYTRPQVEPDLDVPDLEWVLEQLATKRMSAEMTAAAAKIRYRGPKTIAHIQDYTRKEVRQLLQEIAYHATYPEFDDDQASPIPQQRLLAKAIEGELQRQYERGVLSLSARWDSVLMWSHYGEQHRGVCVGYSVHHLSGEPPLRVRYGGHRLIAASRVKAMLEGDLTARREVDRSVLLKKAWDWRYEKEWRMLGTKGLLHSTLELEEVIFGLRCSSSVKHAVRSALAGRDRRVVFFEIREVPGRFELKRRRMYAGVKYAPQRWLSMVKEFESLPAAEEHRADYR